MPRVLVATGVVVAVALVAGQLLVPGLVSSGVEERLEADGGSARVSIGAFPAVTLAWGRGGSIRIRGEGLLFDLGDRSERPLERLDGFETVEIDLTSTRAGPVDVTEFFLRRESREAPYRLAVRATVTPRDIAGEIGPRAEGLLGRLAGGLAGRALPGDSGMRIPLRLSADVRSEAGRPVLSGEQASVAGFPAGPLTGVLLAAVVDRL